MKFRAEVRNLIDNSLHFNKNVESLPIPDSPESAKIQHAPGRDGDSGVLCYNWNTELVHSNLIDWREEITKAKENEGCLIPEDSQDPAHAWLNALADTGKLPRDMTKE